MIEDGEKALPIAAVKQMDTVLRLEEEQAIIIQMSILIEALDLYLLDRWKTRGATLVESIKQNCLIEYQEINFNWRKKLVVSMQFS